MVWSRPDSNVDLPAHLQVRALVLGKVCRMLPAGIRVCLGHAILRCVVYVQDCSTGLTQVPALHLCWWGVVYS